MTPRLERYIDAGRHLDADERELAALALQSVGEEDQDEVDRAWAEEVERRIDEVIEGGVTLVSGRETLEKARSRSGRRPA